MGNLHTREVPSPFTAGLRIIRNPFPEKEDVKVLTFEVNL
jgi:hypothetical protein